MRNTKSVESIETAFTEANGKLHYEKPSIALLSSHFTEGKQMYVPYEQMAMGTMTYGPS